MLARKKRAGRRLDRECGDRYHRDAMFRQVLFLLAIGWLNACSPYKAIRKSNDEFKKLCESVMGDVVATSTTNEADTASLRPRLIAPGMQIAVTVAEDASLNRAYLVPLGCALE